MSPQGLYRADIDPTFQQMSREGVAKGVATSAFGDGCPLHRPFDLALK